MRLNIVRDLVKQLTVSRQPPNKSRHLNELTHEPVMWSWDTGQGLSCFDSCQFTILWMSYIKDVDLPSHACDTPSFLLIVSPTPPVQSVNAYVRSANHVTTKRKEVDHIPWECGSVQRALRSRWSPAKKCLAPFKGFRIPGTGFHSLSVELLDSECKSQVGFRHYFRFQIPDSRFRIPQAQFSQIPYATSKHFLDSEIRIPLHGAIEQKWIKIK